MIRTTAQPRRLTTPRSTARIAAAAATSSPLSGSSSSSTAGSAASARAICYPLGLAAGQLAWFAVGELLGVDLAQPAQRGHLVLAAREHARDPVPAARPERHIGSNAHVRKQQRVL